MPDIMTGLIRRYPSTDRTGARIIRVHRLAGVNRVRTALHDPVHRASRNYFIKIRTSI